MSRIKFQRWMKRVDALGQREGIFDPPTIRFLCPGSHPRRPHDGEDGFFFTAYQSGMSPRQALGEALVEHDNE